MTHFVRFAMVGVIVAGASCCALAQQQDDDLDSLLEGLIEEPAAQPEKPADKEPAAEPDKPAEQVADEPAGNPAVKPAGPSVPHELSADRVGKLYLHMQTVRGVLPLSVLPYLV